MVSSGIVMHHAKEEGIDKLSYVNLYHLRVYAFTTSDVLSSTFIIFEDGVKDSRWNPRRDCVSVRTNDYKKAWIDLFPIPMSAIDKMLTRLGN